MRRLIPILFHMVLILSLASLSASAASPGKKAAPAQGIYEICSATDDRFVVDLRTCLTQELTESVPQMYQSLDVNQQKFYFEELPGSVYRIFALSSGEALTAADSSSAEETSASGTSCDGTVASCLTTAPLPDSGTHAVLKSQSWILHEAGDGAYYLESRAGNYLTLDASSPYNEASLTLERFTGKNTQKWLLKETLISTQDTAETDNSNPYEEGGKYRTLRLSIAFGPQTELLFASEIASWMKEGEDGHLTLEQDCITSYVQTLADTYDTRDKSRRFRTSHGTEITLTTGNFGWKMDTEQTAALLEDAIQSRGRQTMDPAWSSKGGSLGGQNDIGDSYVEVDLANQKVWLYKDGIQLLETDMVSGTYGTDRQTPAGVYSIYYMQSPAVLTGADYQSPVDYWMAYNGGIGLHDANWRSEFGGDIYLSNGSHGCINLPTEAAKLIYETVSIGYPVVSYQ